MKQLTVDELGVVIELVHQYARECESGYYEAENESKTRRAKALEMGGEAMETRCDRMFEIFEEDFGVPADLVDDMRFADVFEKRLIESHSKRS